MRNSFRARLRARRWAGILLAGAVLLMTGGCASQEEDTGAGYLFTTVLPGDPECLDPQFTQNENAEIVIRNTMEGLMRFVDAGEPVPAGAETFTISGDGLVYTFTLRSDAYWFSKNMDADRPERVTSRDYVFAFRRIADPAMRSPYAEDFRCIKNASAIMAGEQEARYLGVSAPDGNTVMFELEYPDPDFLSRLCQTCAVPCNQEFFESTDGRYGLDADTYLCNGAFYLTQWNYDQYSSGNFLTFRKCKHYHDPDDVFPSSLQFNIMHTRDAAETDFAEGNADVLLTDRYPKAQMHDTRYNVQSAAATTMGLIFNPDNEILKDDDLRQALAMSIDREALEPMLGEDVSAAYGLIPPAVKLLGTSYREIQADEPLALPYDPDKAVELFAGSAQELGIGTMNAIRVMVPSTLPDTEALLAMSQNWQDLFGYYIGIETVSPDEFASRLASGDYAIALYSMTPERGGCYDALAAYTDRAAMLGMPESVDITALMNGLAKPINLADTAALSASIEKLIIDTHCFVPLFYKNRYCIATAGNVDIQFDPFKLSADFIHAKHFAK